MGTFCSHMQKQDLVKKTEEIKSVEEKKTKDNLEAIKIWPTLSDPCTYLKGSAKFGDPRIYTIHDGQVPVVPVFQEYGMIRQYELTVSPQDKAQFVHNVQTRGWYPPSVFTTQYAAWIEDPTVVDAILQRFVSALRRRPVIHPVFTGSRTTYRLNIEKTSEVGILQVQYCVADLTGWRIYSLEVPRNALLSGSFWHDVEYHERHNTPEAAKAQDEKEYE